MWQVWTPRAHPAEGPTGDAKGCLEETLDSQLTQTPETLRRLAEKSAQRVGARHIFSSREGMMTAAFKEITQRGEAARPRRERLFHLNTR